MNKKKVIDKDGLEIGENARIKVLEANRAFIKAAKISEVELSKGAFITDRKNLEIQLKTSEEKYRALFENSFDAILLTGLDGKIYFANPAACRLFGSSEEELCWLGRNGTVDITDPRLEPGLKERELKGQFYGELTFIKKDGTRFPGELSSNVFRDSEGRQLTSMIIRDITDRRKAETAIQESEKRYHFLFDNMVNGLAYCQMLYDDSGNPVDFIYLEVNEAFSKLTGLSKVVGKRVTEVIPGVFQMDNELFNIYGRVASTGEPENCEIMVRSLDHWFSISVYCPLKNHFVAIFDVISDRKNAEEKLLASEAEFRSLFENSIIGISQSYPEGNLIRINKAYVEMYGYPDSSTMLDEVAENTKILFSNPNDRKKVFETLNKTGYMAPTEFELNRRNGDKFWALVMAKQVRDNAGKLLYLQAEHIDITRQKKLDAELRKSKVLLEKLNQHLVDIREDERNQIALSLHDDLGQKLTAINFDIGWLKSRIGFHSQAVNEKIKEMSQMIVETIQSIKETASLLRPSILFDFGLVPAIKAQVKHFEKQTGIISHFFCEPERFVLDNRISLILYRILQESITNIARHSGASLTEINLHVLKNKVEMSIKDNGKGIKKNQINSMKSMGIEGIKERVRSAQGKISIRGIHGSGTTIKVLIPLH